MKYFSKPFKWSERNPKGPATEPVELVDGKGRLTGISLRTLINGWGGFQEPDRKDVEESVLQLLNGDLVETLRGVKIMANSGSFKQWEGEPWLEKVKKLELV